MNILIGHTGFVGSNLCKDMAFDLLINSKNINDIVNIECESIVFCGMPAEKWKINQNSEIDDVNTQNLINILRTVKCKSFTLISTIDIYDNPIECDENTIQDIPSHAYGKNRFLFEQFISTYFNHQIIRLPGLFGSGLKKNIIYDLMNDNNIHLINSNNAFQWYPISHLNKDLQILKEHPNIKLINFGTEPISTSELVNECFPNQRLTEFEFGNVKYNMKTKYASIFGSTGDYILNKNQIINELKEYIK